MKGEVSMNKEDILLMKSIVREVTTEVIHDAVDEKFAAIDKRFEAIDKRFEAIDEKFEAIDERFAEFEVKMECMMDEKIRASENRVLEYIDFVQEGIYKRITRLEEEFEKFKTYCHIAELDSEEHKIMLKKIEELEQRLGILENKIA